MDLANTLSRAAAEIVSDAESELARAGVPHYERSGPQLNRARLDSLFAVLVDSVRRGDLVGMTGTIDRIARDRYAEGFGLIEVQTAVNVLEEAVWRHITTHAPLESVADSLARVSATLGAAKDALGRTYVELAAARHAPSVDVAALAGGAAAV